MSYLFAGGVFEILQELTKCTTETQSEQMLLEKHPQTLGTGLPQTFNYLLKNAVSPEHEKAKHDTVRSAI